MPFMKLGSGRRRDETTVPHLRALVTEVLKRMEAAGLPGLVVVALRSFLTTASDDDLRNGAKAAAPLLRMFADQLEDASQRDI